MLELPSNPPPTYTLNVIYSAFLSYGESMIILFIKQIKKTVEMGKLTLE